MNLKHALQQCQETGMLWITGEMQFPVNQGADVAFARAAYIAEHCGYIVVWKHRHKSFNIAGGDINGYVTCTWDHLACIVKVEHWMQTTFWNDKEQHCEPLPTTNPR